MNGKLKKFLSVFLCFSLLSGLFTLVSFAESYYYNGWEYEIQKEGDYQYALITKDAFTEWDRSLGLEGKEYASIVRYTGTAANIKIPVSLGGQPVIWIAQAAFKDNSAIQKLEIPVQSSIRYIGEEAFKNCVGLQSALIAKSVEVIADDAFRDCGALKSFLFENESAIKTIGNHAFRGCLSLPSFSIQNKVESIGTGAFYDCDSLETIAIPDGVKELGGGAFRSCDSLQTAEIGSGVKVLRHDYWDGGCFEDCKSMTAVTIGSGVKVIEECAFKNCRLFDLTIPENVLRIGNSAFEKCESLKSAKTGDGLLAIGDAAFFGDISLETVSFGQKLESIGNTAFAECSSLLNVDLPTNIVSLGEGAFAKCSALKTVTIGDGIKKLSHNYWNGGCFENCVSLTSVSIGSGVREIGDSSFASTALEKLIIPDNVITLGDAVAKKCVNLKEVIIGNGTTTIGNEAFMDDAALASVSIGRGVTTIGNSAFVNCSSLKTVLLPPNVTSLGEGAFSGCSSLKTAVVGNGVKDLTTNYWHGGVFKNCSALDRLSIGSGLLTIDDISFEGTAITKLVVPYKVNTLNDRAFANAGQLSKIYFAGDLAPSVGKNLFDGIAEGYELYSIKNKIGFDKLDHTVKEYKPITISFDKNDERVSCNAIVEQIMSPDGGYVIEPVIPDAFGFHFEGWYTEKECKNKWDFSDLSKDVKKNMTLYAKWLNTSTEMTPLQVSQIESSDITADSITLSWASVDGADGYNVYQDGVKINDELIGDTKYTVSGLKPTTTYAFEVSGTNTVGEGAHSLKFVERTQHEHIWTDWEILKQPTEDQPGERKHQCFYCGVEDKEEFFLGEHEHIWGEWESQDDENHMHKCTLCSTEELEAHKWNKGKVTTAATCADDGEKTFTCTVCGETKTEEIPATGKHTFGEWEVVEPATEEEEGEEQRVCTVCGESESRAIPKTGTKTLYGDATGDGVVDLDDCLVIMDYYVGKDVKIDEKAADASADGVVDLDDCLLIMDYYVGKDVVLGPKNS